MCRDATVSLHNQPLSRIVRRLILHGVKLLAQWALKNGQQQLVDFRMIAGTHCRYFFECKADRRRTR